MTSGMVIDMADEQTFLDMLIESLQLLAADYETQIEALPRFVDVPDELVSTYEASLSLLDQIQESGLITDLQIVELLRNLDARFDEMSKDASLWTLEALRTRREWQEIRSSASKLLTVLGKQKRVPNLWWITYVSGGDQGET